jgi:hypothetical protein
MRPHEGMLSGYLLARAAMGRKIDDDPEVVKLPGGGTRKSEHVLKDLRAANATVEEARRLLPNGRGNVAEDILSTRGEASRLYEAGLRLEEKYRIRHGLHQHENRLFDIAAKTAASLLTGQASCNGSAVLAAHLHAHKLEKDQGAIVFHNPAADHMWTETRRLGMNRMNDPILDRWTSGPAVLRQDSKYGRSPAGYDYFTLDAENREGALRAAENSLREMKGDRRLVESFKIDMLKLKITDYRFNGEVHREESVMSDDFRRKAGKALHPRSSKVPKSDTILGRDGKAPVRPFAQEILAVGVARSLGEEVRGAVEKAPAILDAAKRMFPKPPKGPVAP